MKRLFSFITLLLLVLLLGILTGCAAEKETIGTESLEKTDNTDSTDSPESTGNIPYEELRTTLFEQTPESLGIQVNEEKQPFIVLMDIGYPEGVGTLVTLLDGNASLYLSNGSGIIGGIKNENVRNLAVDLVNKSKDYVDLMEKTDIFPTPQSGFINFYLITGNGVYKYSQEEDLLQRSDNEFVVLYNLGQDVITALLETVEDGSNS